MLSPRYSPCRWVRVVLILLPVLLFATACSDAVMEEILAALPTPTAAAPPPAVPAAPAVPPAEATALAQQTADLQARSAQIDAEMARLRAELNALLAAGDPDPAQLAALEQQLAQLAAEIAQIERDIGALQAQLTTADRPVQVFFTAPPCTDDPANRTPPPHLPVLLDDINNATDSVYVAMYEYELPAVASALAAAHERGVDVQLALDEETGAESDDPNWGDLLGDLNIPISWETGTRFMHSKFFIIDNDIVWTGSWNATDNDTYRNNNNVLRLRVPDITANYNAEFSQMMLGFFGNDKTASTPNPNITLADGTRIETHFAPVEPVEDFVVARIASANERIAFMTFSYTEDVMGDAMRERLAAGVAVTGVFEGRNANGTGSEYARLVDAGADVLTDGNGYTMHHKVIIIDRQTVITGSFNYSARAMDTNDENLLIIDNPAIAAAFEDEFSRVYTLAADPSICD